MPGDAFDDGLGWGTMPKKVSRHFLRTFFATPRLKSAKAGGGEGAEKLEADGITYLRPPTGVPAEGKNVVIKLAHDDGSGAVYDEWCAGAMEGGGAIRMADDTVEEAGDRVVMLESQYEVSASSARNALPPKLS